VHILRIKYRKRNRNNVCAKRRKDIIFLLLQMLKESFKARKKIFGNQMEQKIQERKTGIAKTKNHPLGKLLRHRGIK